MLARGESPPGVAPSGLNRRPARRRLALPGGIRCGGLTISDLALRLGDESFVTLDRLRVHVATDGRWGG
jgi:hypothetical protein